MLWVLTRVAKGWVSLTNEVGCAHKLDVPKNGSVVKVADRNFIICKNSSIQDHILKANQKKEESVNVSFRRVKYLHQWLDLT